MILITDYCFYLLYTFIKKAHLYGKPLYEIHYSQIHDLPYLSQDMMIMMDVKNVSHFSGLFMQI